MESANKTPQVHQQSYESTDPDRYEEALQLVEQFEALPEADKDAIFPRILALRNGTSPKGEDGMGSVEAVAQAMLERSAAIAGQPDSLPPVEQ